MGYRQATITVPNLFVVTKNGLNVDIYGLIPGVFGKVELPNEPIFDVPRTVVSPIGQTWRLFGKRVAGGNVIVGIYSPDNLTEADKKLLENAAKFGSTIDQAASVSGREIAEDVEYAVVSSNGELKGACGQIPLKTNPNVLPISYDHLVPLVSNGKPYWLYSQAICDSNGRDVGTVIIPKEMALAQEALRIQDKFNYWVVGIVALLAIGTAMWLVAHTFFGQTKRVTIEEALKVGESETVEFKSSFYWDPNQQEYLEKRKLAILKSITGFLNARGGTLFIGVIESPPSPPSLCGLDKDLEYYKGSKDKLRQTLWNLIKTKIGAGAQFSSLITDNLEESDGKLYWRVIVEESRTGPAWVHWEGQAKFHVREGPRTNDLDPESTYQYIKNKWG